MKIFTALLSVAALAAGAASAETVLYYQFAPGADSFKSQTNSPALDAKAQPAAKTEVTSDVPGKTIVAGDKVVNADNTGSLNVVKNFHGGSLDVPADAKLAAKSVTVEFFLKADKSGPWATILDFSREGNDTHTWMFQRGEKTPKARIRLDFNTSGDKSDANWCRDGVAEVFDGKWHHLAMTFDGASKTAKYYVDYKLASEGVAPKGLVFGDNRLRILPQMAGQIDELRISDAVLEPAQMLKVK